MFRPGGIICWHWGERWTGWPTRAPRSASRGGSGRTTPVDRRSRSARRIRLRGRGPGGSASFGADRRTGTVDHGCRCRGAGTRCARRTRPRRSVPGRRTGRRLGGSGGTGSAEALRNGGGSRARGRTDRTRANTLAQRSRPRWPSSSPSSGSSRLDASTDVVNGRGQERLPHVLAVMNCGEVGGGCRRRHRGDRRSMSQGRYSSRIPTRQEAGDPWRDAARRALDDYPAWAACAKTLSGGRAFLASLSLALGLA